MQKGIDYEKKASIGLIIVGYIFALLGGIIGFSIGLNLIVAKVQLWSGSNGKKYCKSSRIHGAVIILLSMLNGALIILLLALI